MFNTKEQHISQEGTIRIIISDMVKKGDSIVSDFPLTSMMVRSFCGHSLMPQYYNKFNFPIITTTKSQKYRSISFGAPLVPLWLSYRLLKLICSVFLDEPNGQAEREEGSKFLRRCTLFTNTGSLTRETDSFAPHAYIYKAINISSQIQSCYITDNNFKIKIQGCPLRLYGISINVLS